MTARRALVYVRLSSHRGEADPSTSPEEQERKARAYCEAQGWDVADVVTDLDVSGSDKGLRLDRPGLSEVRRRFPEVDVVIFAKLDRLARNVLDFNRFAEEAASHNVALVSVAEALDLSTASGRFVANILAAFAEMEAATIAARVRDGRAALRSLRRHSGPAPYGYRTCPHPSGRGRGLEIDPEEAAHLRRAAEAVLSGASLYRVARDLTAAGSRPRRAAQWSVPTLRRVLTGDAILGRMRHDGRVLTDDDGLPLSVWEPIISEEESARLRALYPVRVLPEDDTRATAADDNRREAHRSRADRLLSGLMRCESCGSVMIVRQGRPLPGYGEPLPDDHLGPRGPRTPRYVCGNATAACPRRVTLDARRAEDYAARALLSMAGAWPVVIERKVARDSAALAEIETALTETGAAIAAARGPERAALLDRLDVLQARADEMRARPAAPTVERVETGETFSEAWQRADTAERRSLLASVLAGEIVARPGARGVRSVDSERLSIPWRWSEPDTDALLRDAMAD